MLLIEWIEEKLKLGYTEEQMSEMSGVSQQLVHDIFYNHRVVDCGSWLALNRALKEPSSKVEEERTVYMREHFQSKLQERYTLVDYYELPGDLYVQLIDGKFYYGSAPSLIHQAIVMKISFTIEKYINKNKGECMTFVAPTDVRLNCDDNTMVQPDIFVVCNRDKLKNNKHVYGNPDFVVEVLSPSTKNTDIFVKCQAYREAGVKEYWIIDPDKKVIIVHLFGENACTNMYGFDDQVPIRIYNDECVIDFSEIYEKIRFLYEESE